VRKCVVHVCVTRQDAERVMRHMEVWRQVSDFGQSKAQDWVVILESDAIFNPFVHNYYHAAIQDGMKHFFCEKTDTQGPLIIILYILFSVF